MFNRKKESEIDYLARVEKFCYDYGIYEFTMREIIDKFGNTERFIDVDSSVNLHRKGLSFIPFQFGNIKGDFDCSNNSLTSLKGAPQKVKGYFSCSNNHLESLRYSPVKVGGEFDFSTNKVKSFEHMPKVIYGDIVCVDNHFLGSFEHFSGDVRGRLWCYNMDVYEHSFDVLFEKGYTPDRIKAQPVFDIKMLYRQWGLRNIINS